MTPSAELELRQKELIRQIVDHPLFRTALDSVRQGITREMMTEEDAGKRNALFIEAKTLGRLEGRLTAIANEVRSYEHLAADEKARVDALNPKGAA